MPRYSLWQTVCQRHVTVAHLFPREQSSAKGVDRVEHSVREAERSVGGLRLQDRTNQEQAEHLRLQNIAPFGNPTYSRSNSTRCRCLAADPMRNRKCHSRLWRRHYRGMLYGICAQVSCLTFEASG